VKAATGAAASVAGMSRIESPRTYFIDRLRVVLTALVILHHTAITYGGSGGWFYREVLDGGTPTSLLLTVFCAVNQSFFMGMFFLLAGYYTPAALARKGAGPYLKERLVRLGIPLMVFGFVLGPLTVALAGVPAGSDVLDRWAQLLASGRFVIGPLWFAWALLIFAIGFVVWHALRPGPAHEAARPVPPTSAWIAAALAVGAAALALRQVVPVGREVIGLQLGYFASYVFLFALGCAAGPHRWLERLERSQARPWKRVSLAVAPVLFVTAALTGALQGKPVEFGGGLGAAAVVYAFWEPLVAWGIIAGLLVTFRERFDAPSARWQRWGAHAYGAFIVHAPVLVALSVLLAGWAAPPLLKFAVVGSASIAASFAIAGALRRLPGVDRVL
jgi:peptidoglycan/LPS O-acetylase OafA/YrhL